MFFLPSAANGGGATPVFERNIFPLKLVLMGETCGKTCLVDRFVSRRFKERSWPTFGYDLTKQTFRLDGTTVRLEIWDSYCENGKQRLHYYRNALAAIVVYDITNKESFSFAQGSVELLRRGALSKTIIALVGNKADLAHKRMEAEVYAHKNDLLFMETSAKTGMNVDDIFCTIARKVYGIGGALADVERIPKRPPPYLAEPPEGVSNDEINATICEWAKASPYHLFCLKGTAGDDGLVLLSRDMSVQTVVSIPKCVAESLQVLYQPRQLGFANEKPRQQAALRIDQRKLCLKVILSEKEIVPLSSLKVIQAVKTAVDISFDAYRVRRSLESDREMFVHFKHFEDLEKADRTQIGDLKTYVFYDGDLQAEQVQQQPQTAAAETNVAQGCFNVESILPVLVVVLGVLLLLGAVKVGAINGTRFIVFVLAVVFLAFCRDALAGGKDASGLSTPAQE